MIRIKKYSPANRKEWDSLVKCSKNGCFLFLRDYMEYHSDRYQDNSLLVYNGNSLIAVIPCNIVEKKLISHGGLTFGGVISNQKMKTQIMLDTFGKLLEYMGENSIASITYKVPPKFLQQIPAEEDLYALFRFKAKLIRRDVSTVVDINNRVKLNKGRKWIINKAKKNDVSVSISQDFETFMSILRDSLGKHGVKPTHSLEEIIYLKNKFPKNISLYTAQLNDDILAGAILYDYGQTIHTQYLATTEQGKQIGALDYVISKLIATICNDKRFFSFGISTEQNGKYLNEGLIHQKEGFGGRAIVHDYYEMRVE